MKTSPDYNGKPNNSGINNIFINLFKVVKILVLVLVLYFIIRNVVDLVQVQNAGMEPTLIAGETLLVNKLKYKLGEIKYGDMVAFYYPQQSEQENIRRVIGLPGDKVTIKKSKVWVNDQELNEPYIAASPEYSGEWVVPDRSLFVLGDNRNFSEDSHNRGFVPFDNVSGKAIAVIWPLINFRGLPTPNIFSSNIAPVENIFVSEQTPTPMIIEMNDKFIIRQVQNGDNLSQFAKKYGTSEGAIIRVNYFINLPLIKNDLIVIPVGFSSVAQMPYFQPYEVTEEGLTIDDLAAEFAANLDDLIAYNGIDKGNQLNIGDWLIIPRNAPGY